MGNATSTSDVRRRKLQFCPLARVFEKLGFWRDDSPRARSFAEVPDDIVFAIDRVAFDRLHGAIVVGIRIAAHG